MNEEKMVETMNEESKTGEAKYTHPIVVGGNFIYNALIEPREGVTPPIVNYGQGLIAELNGYAIIPVERYMELRKAEDPDFEEEGIYQDPKWRASIAEADEEIVEQKAIALADAKANVAALERQIEIVEENAEEN